MTKEKTFIGYARVSTARQGASGLGLDAQQTAIEDHVKGKGRLALPIFVEVESGKRDDRPELEKALAMAKLTGATLVVAKLDRLSRNAQFLMSLVDSGADVVFCDLPEIPPGPVGRFLLQQMAAVAELERGLISQRTKAALIVAKARGVRLGGYKGGKKADPVLGLSARRQAAQDFRDRVMPTIQELQANGVTTANAIAQRLTDAGIQTARKGKAWSAVQVLRLLDA